MKKAADLADSRINLIRDVETEMNNLAASGMQKPPEWDSLSYQEKLDHLDNMKNMFTNVSDVSEKLVDMTDKEQDTIKDLGNLGVSPVVSKARFNLSKQGQEMQPLPDSSIPFDTNNDGQTNVSEVRALLDGFVSSKIEQGMEETDALSQSVDEAFNYIVDNFTNKNDSTVDPSTGSSGNSQQLVRNAISSYYSTADESEKDQIAGTLARTIFPQGPDENNGIPAKEKSVKINLSKVVEDTNKILKALAEKDSNKKSASFNLSKQAHTRNVVVFDPNTAIKDEIHGGEMGQNDLLERNKGWGLKLDNYYTANWEKVWREVVMDKYDPFYIERRFEVDSNIPTGNNYQLEHGETRRPYLPEYSSIEARLEDNRDNANKKRLDETGVSQGDSGKVFNWKKAQTKKKINTSQVANNGLQPLKPLEAPKSPFDAKPLSQVFTCSICGNPLALDPHTKAPVEGVCSKCGGSGQTAGQIKTAPDPIKTQSNKIEVEKLATLRDGIFFHEGKFLVVASKKTQKFDTYIEAKQFKQLIANPEEVVQEPSNLKQKQVERRRELSQHADGLGIDG